MHATLEIARRIDRAEIDFCAMATLIAAPEAATLDRGGGLAVYAAPGLPVNKVLGLGLGAEVSDDDLDAIEQFYAERGCPVQIELCPLAAPDLPARQTDAAGKLSPSCDYAPAGAAFFPRFHKPSSPSSNKV